MFHTVAQQGFREEAKKYYVHFAD